MNIFLTGGTGFIGSYFLKLALKSGHFVYAISRKKQKEKHKRLKWLHGKIDKNWKNALQKSDILVHFASLGVNNKSISYKKAFKFNVKDSFKLFKNAIKNNCKNWLIAGTSSEYGLSCSIKKKLNVKTKPLPKTTYEKTKYIFSKKILLLSKKERCKCRLMRIFPVYGLGENKKRLWPSLIQAAENKKNFKMTHGNQIRDFTNVEYVSKVMLDACNFNKRKFRHSQVWHVSSGKAISIKNFAKKIWKKKKAKGKLIFGAIASRDNYNYISDKKSIWKI